MHESVRVYTLKDGTPVSHTLKVAARDSGKDLFVQDPDDSDYKKINKNDIFDEDTQQLLPNNGQMWKLLSHERFFEVLQDSTPSVTSMSSILKQDGITRWTVNNIINFFLADYPEEDHAELKAQALAAAKPTEAAERGQRFHSAIEQSIQGNAWADCLDNDHERGAFNKINEAFSQYLDKSFSKNDEREYERSFINDEMGYSGTADFRIGNCVMDYKFSDKAVYNARGTFVKSNWVYPERALQLAAYADGLQIENPTLANVFCNVHTGDIHVHIWENPEKYLFSWRLLCMFWYSYHVGKFPAEGVNTAAMLATLKEWSYE